MSRRILGRQVVTGVGLATPLGGNWKDSWKALLDGKSGLQATDRYTAVGLHCQVAGQVDLDPATVAALPRCKSNLVNRDTLLARVAAAEALASEIVNDSNGRLIPKETDPGQLAEEIKAFRNLSRTERIDYRTSALETYREKSHFESNISHFIEFLLS